MEGSGSSTVLKTGPQMGGIEPTIVGRFPALLGSEHSMVVNPETMLFYFIRDDKVYEYSPERKEVEEISSEPSASVVVHPDGSIIVATRNKQVDN